MKELGELWPQLFKDRVLGGEAPVLLIVTPLWPRIVGKPIAREVQPVAFCNGVLTLEAPSESWVIQLRSMSEQVRSRVNGFLGGPLVKDLRVRRRYARGTQAKSDSEDSGPDLPLAAAAKLWADADVKLDRDVAGIVERSFTKYFSRQTKEMKRCC